MTFGAQASQLPALIRSTVTLPSGEVIVTTMELRTFRYKPCYRVEVSALGLSMIGEFSPAAAHEFERRATENLRRLAGRIRVVARHVGLEDVAVADLVRSEADAGISPDAALDGIALEHRDDPPPRGDGMRRAHVRLVQS